MGIIDYLSVLISILIGLSIADIAVSFHKLMRHRKRVKWHWISPTLAIIMLLQVLGFWWIWMDIYEGRTSLSLAYFLPDIVVFILLFLACAVVLPDDVDAEGVDLREYYWSTVPYFWVVFLLMGLLFMGLIIPKFYAGESVAAILLVNIPNIILNGFVAILIFVRNAKVHGAIIALLLVYSLMIQLASVLQSSGAT